MFFRYISGSDSICRGKRGTGGVHCAKSKTSKLPALIFVLFNYLDVKQVIKTNKFNTRH